jgi:hypothetical protein
VRRLVAALLSGYWPRTGSLLPFSGGTNAWFWARRGIPGSKLPVWGGIGLMKAATSRRTPNAFSTPCVKNYAALDEGEKTGPVLSLCKLNWYG